MRFAISRLPITNRRILTGKLLPVVLDGLLLLLICVPGCGKSSGKAAVRGHVSYRGAPLESASLTFFPASGRPEATTVSKGEYSIELARQNHWRIRTPGEYTAIVLIGIDLPKGYKEGDPVPPPKIVLPEEYTSRAKSPLKAVVSSGQAEPIDFDLK
jgi:hypothetical protein